MNTAKKIEEMDLWRAYAVKGGEGFEPGYATGEGAVEEEDWFEADTPATEQLHPPDPWLAELTGASQSLNDVDLTIEKSKALLDIPDDWDGDGAVGYEEETLRRATSIARSLCWLAVRQYARGLSCPTISAADEGSIDLFWRMDGRYLLINIPRDPDEPYTFYGESDGTESLSGVSRKLREDLVIWLIRG